MNGVYCANFATSRSPWRACKAVWCGTCYVPHALDRFYHHVPTDDEGFDWRPDADRLKHFQARNGDHLVTPFQCDLCVFRNLQHRNPIADNPKDELLLCCIRRANLDAVWGRESNTVRSTLAAAKQMTKLWKQVGVAPNFPALGPFPVGDSLGFGVAIAMLLKSLEPGRYSKEYQQFETIRKLRAGYSNIYMASVEGVTSLRTVGGDRVKHHLTASPTQSLWFERFAQGCVRRMGQDVRQDWAIPLAAMHALVTLLDKEWSEANDFARKELISSLGAFALIAFCGSFRGAEVFLVDLRGLKKYHKDLSESGELNHIIVPLLGRFKGEDNARYHLAPLASVTNSGLRVKLWVERLLEVRMREGRFQGPAFCDRQGHIMESHVYQDAYAERLQVIQSSSTGIIPEDLDVLEEFGISRSFRRGSTSTARTRGVDDKLVDLINRWRKFEKARGRRPTLAMHEHYSDIQILIPELVKYSQAL
jgi:hypothetical protein